MPFLTVEPFTSAKAVYDDFDHTYVVTVKGEARKITSGIVLVKIAGSPNLEVEVKGWTGPLERGEEPYEVSGHFPGEYHATMRVHGSNKTETIKVPVLVSETVPA